MRTRTHGAREGECGEGNGESGASHDGESWACVCFEG